VICDGAVTHEACVLLRGFAFRQKMLPNGSRQILAFHMAGDFVDLQSLYLVRMDHTLETLGAALVGFIPHAAIKQAIAGSTRLLAAFWRDTLIDAAIFREWVTNIGQRSAYSRLAHVICEVAWRLKARGLGAPDHFRFPVTQAHLADATGITTVHVNRVLNGLKKAGLVKYNGGEWRIPDLSALEAAAGFDPAYLHSETLTV
jgi:CRP-like cAMP-binding protein